MTSSPSSPLPPSGDDAAGLVIRLAGPADLDAIAALETTSFATDQLTRRSVRALIDAPSARLMVAARDAAIAGYALVLLRRGSQVARLYSVAVAAGEAGRGIGHRLVEAAETAALEAGARALRLEVRGDNGRAIALYQNMGFGRIGERPHYYEDGMTAIRFEKPLGVRTNTYRAHTAGEPSVPAERGI